MSDARTLPSVLGTGEPDAVALQTPSSSSTVTYAELADSVAALSVALGEAGVGHGDRIALTVPRGLDFVQIMLAVTACGAAAAPLNPAYSAEECAFYLGDLQPRALIVSEGDGSAVRQAAEELSVLELREGSSARLSLGGRTGRQSPSTRANATPDDLALLLHTSGTTSRPKQVPLLHRNLTASARTIADHYRLTAEDVSFAAMPLFHVHGLVASVLAQLVVGGKVIVPDRLSARDFWSALSEQRVSWFSGSPTILAMLLDRKPETLDAPALRFARSCSAPLSTPFAQRLEGELGVPILQAYGMTEASHQIASNPLPPLARDPESVGIATGTDVTALDIEGRELPPGTTGELAIRGPAVIAGYLENPEANATSFSNGWFRTGDQGFIDDRGHVRLVGRLKELINRGGEKISPYEVEDILRGHPAVVDVACFAVPDAKYGESVGAAVVCSEPISERDLLAQCADRLAAFKHPRTVYFVDSLPKTATGKVQRSQLAAALANHPS